MVLGDMQLVEQHLFNSRHVVALKGLHQIIAALTLALIKDSSLLDIISAYKIET